MNRKLFRVLGLSRSGIHAVCDWIRMSYLEKGFSYHFDDYAKPERINDVAKFLPSKCDPNDGPFLWMVEHEDIQFIDLPDLNPNVFTNFDFVDVIVIRNVFNTFASRLKLIQKPITKRLTQIWKQYANEALGNTNYLNQGRKVVIPFDVWHQEPHVGGNRERFAKLLGIEGVGVPTPYIVGPNFSSWQPKNTPANELALFDRWKNYADNKDFWAVFDKQAYDLNTSLFGPNEEILSHLH